MIVDAVAKSKPGGLICEITLDVVLGNLHVYVISEGSGTGKL